MQAGSCDEVSAQLEEVWRLRETLHTPEEQLVMDPKIDGLIDKLKRACGPAYDEPSGALLLRLQTESVEHPNPSGICSTELLVELRPTFSTLTPRKGSRLGG